VLAKILINAWEAYGDDTPPEKRSIVVTTELAGQTTADKFVQISIEDQGHGIDPEICDHMFEPFISTKQTVGVGMGLTVARNALRNMGGDMSMENRPGGGTVAILLHPLTSKQKRPADE
jgi:C4-dicarboxylate-specific signal transduction histidine kinase